MKLTFLGGTGTVTGSKYPVTEGNAKVLVDCGLFQGHKQLSLRNWGPPPIAPGSTFILTHADLDHTDYLPLLIKRPFAGKIYCSEATYDLCKILLPDSGHLQEEEAELLEEANGSGEWDFGRHILPRASRSHRVFA